MLKKNEEEEEKQHKMNWKKGSMILKKFRV
jgi:hypothetical protein